MSRPTQAGWKWMEQWYANRSADRFVGSPSPETMDTVRRVNAVMTQMVGEVPPTLKDVVDEWRKKNP